MLKSIVFLSPLTQAEMGRLYKRVGGIFIYALSIMDAYYWAKYRLEAFKKAD